MIKNIDEDIFEVHDLTHIVHQANLYHTFGSGIAKQVKQKYREAYNADLTTVYGDHAKLGTYSAACVSNSIRRPLTIINMYSQVGISSKDRTTDYTALSNGLEKIRSWLISIEGVTLGIPFKMGCGLAGGHWPTVLATIKNKFEDVPFDVIICRRGND